MGKIATKKKIISFVFAGILIVIDQLTKLWVLNNLKGINGIDVIQGFLKFTYVENRGAAFGIFQNNAFALGILSSVLLLIVLISIFKDIFKDEKVMWVLMLIFAGGAGNVIDRFARGYVVDFIDLEIGFLRNFPVFNFADCCVSVGASLLFILILTDEKSKNGKKVE